MSLHGSVVEAIARLIKSSWASAMMRSRIEGGLESKVKALQRLWRTQPGGSHGNANPSAFANRELLGWETFDRLEGGELTLLDLLDGVV